MSSSGSRAPWEAPRPSSAKLVKLVEDPRLEALYDHAVRALDLPVHVGVHHGGSIDADVVFIVEL